MPTPESASAERRAHPSTGSRGILRTDLRRETAVVLPLATALVVALSLVSLLAYRAALVQLRAAEHQRLSALTGRLAAQPAPVFDSRLRLPEDASRIAYLDEVGIAVASSDDLAGANLAASNSDSRNPPQGGLALGPNSAVGPVVAVFVPLDRRLPASAPSRTAVTLRVDWPVPVLAQHLQRFPWLAAIVGAANTVLLVLVLSYRRRRLRPLEGLIERAQSVASTEGTSAAGDVAGLLSTLEEALDRLHASRASDPLTDAIEESIRSSEASVDQQSSTGLLLVDAGGTLLALNEVGARWLEVSADVAGQPLREVLATHPELLDVLTSAIERGESVRRRECVVSTVQGERVLGLTLTRLAKGDGGVRGWLGLFTDLTAVQRESRESMLSQSLAQIAEMSAGLAHELRNGMASLRGYTTLLSRSELNEEQTKDVAEMTREVGHLHRVAEDFLSFARPGTARSEPIDLGEIARRASRDPALADSAARIEVEASSPAGAESPPQLFGDPLLLERALRNLLHNAVRSQRERASNSAREEIIEAVTVRVGFGAGSSGDASPMPTVTPPIGWWVEVLDRGPGIPDDLREKLFTPFASGSEDGVGLGLALARRIADLHQAELTLEDREAGGTRARLSFPT